MAGTVLKDMAIGLVAPIPFIALVGTLKAIDFPKGSTYDLSAYAKATFATLPAVFAALSYLEDSKGRTTRLVATQLFCCQTTYFAYSSRLYESWPAWGWAVYHTVKAATYFVVLDWAVPMLRSA